MPSADVLWPIPLIRQKIFYPGQFGVPGTDNERGLRSHVSGVVFYVDPNAAGVSDARDGTDPEAPLNTVAAALALCQNYRGDTIVVMANGAWPTADIPNDYDTIVQESVTVTVDGVRIVGRFASSAVGVPWQPAAAAGTCITVSAMDVLIEGFAFTGNGAAANGIYAEWDGTTLWADNLTVRNCYFDEDIDTAIQLEFTWYADIHNNIFQECDVLGIMSDVAGSGIAFCAIHNNRFIDLRGTGAISLLGGADDNEIYENRIFNRNAESAAAATNEGINTTGGARNLIHHNTLSCLLPVPANGDYDDFNTAAATDAWIQNYCLDGPSVTNPT
jgi:hypothetical protein